MGGDFPARVRRHDDVAGEAGMPAEEADQVMEDLWRRRLVMRNAQGYVAVGATA
jgi:hypothetical protein